MKKIFLIALLCSFVYHCWSQTIENTHKKFIGGMLVHTGYIQNTRNLDNISGMCYGLGGQMSFYIGDHFRLGTEGYASNYSYPNNNGFYKLGWGGLMLGYEFASKRLKPVINITVGGGKVKDLYFISGAVDDHNVDNVRYRVYSDILIAPSFNLEYDIKSNLSIVSKVDYIIPVFSTNFTDYAYGPRVYLGILFRK